MSWLKKLIINVIACLLLAFTTTALAGFWQYSIVMGIDSKEANVYLFRYYTGLNLPSIERLVTTSAKLNLLNNQVDTNGQDIIDSLFKEPVAALKNEGADPAMVPVNILISADVQILGGSKEVSEILKNRYALNTVQTRTISIQEKSAYDWLSVNYLADNFKNGKDTVGTIDVGDNSLGIAFATKEKQSSTVATFLINGQTYFVNSDSVFGLGLEAARKSVMPDMKDAAVAVCYPPGFPYVWPTRFMYVFQPGGKYGNFNYQACNGLYAKLLNRLLPKKDPLLSSQKFIVFGGAYDVFHFFEPEAESLNQEALKADIIKACNMQYTLETLWHLWPSLGTKNELAANYPNYIENMCANAVYVDELLFGQNGYLLQDEQLDIKNSIHNEPINWLLGALLYQLIQSPAPS